MPSRIRSLPQFVLPFMGNLKGFLDGVWEDVVVTALLKVAFVEELELCR